MSAPIERLLQDSSLHTRVRRALESGVGLHHTAWRIEGPSAETIEPLATELLAWCQDVMGRMHRPYGMENVTLALAALDDEGHRAASTSYGLLRPLDFYGAGCVEAQLRETLQRWVDEQALAKGGRLSAVLFSWGDLTCELLLVG